MREFGGFEMLMMMGAKFGGAKARQIVIVDGFIATAAACAAVAVDPNIRDYLLFGHLSPNPAIARFLNGSMPGRCWTWKCALAKARGRRLPFRSCAWRNIC